jgi:hypothetical protein
MEHFVYHNSLCVRRRCGKRRHGMRVCATDVDDIPARAGKRNPVMWTVTEGLIAAVDKPQPAQQELSG